MNPIAIHALLKMKGYTMSDIARAKKVSPTSVRKVIHGEMTSRSIATAIAKLVGKTTDELWPGQYPARYKRSDPTAALMKQIEVVEALNAHNKKAA